MKNATFDSAKEEVLKLDKASININIWISYFADEKKDNLFNLIWEKQVIHDWLSHPIPLHAHLWALLSTPSHCGQALNETKWGGKLEGMYV